MPLLEDPSNGLKYCMKCSPPIKSNRNSDSSDSKIVEPFSSEGKLYTYSKNESVSSTREVDGRAHKETLEENINYMMLELSNIGTNALNRTGLSVEKR